MSKIIIEYHSFKKWMVLSIMIFINSNSIAGCDMCSLYLGLHPNQIKNGINIRYRYSLYETSSSHIHNGVAHSTNPQKRVFQTLETWAQYNIGRKMQILVMLPYVMNSVEEKNLVIDAYNNIGDIQSLVRYQLYRSDEENIISSRIAVGLGIKAPTGKYSTIANDGYLDHHIQTGTGSWDILYNIGYMAKLNGLSFNQEVLYKMNTANEMNYRFANRFSSNSTIFYSFTNENISIIPSLGYLIEFAKEDKMNNQLVENTNGTSQYIVGGIDMYFKKINFNLNYQKAFIEDLRDKGTTNKYRFILGFGVNF